MNGVSGQELLERHLRRSAAKNNQKVREMAKDNKVSDFDEDNAHLRTLGYETHFRRDMSIWANFSLGFTYLSPVAGVYTLFAFALATAGPPMIWSIVFVGIGQFLVALVFGEVVSQFPLAGGAYQWSRRLWGKRFGWMTGWVYMMALMATFSGVAYGAGPYLGAFLNVTPSTKVVILGALAIILVALLINAGGTRLLSGMAIFGFLAEFIGALAVGIWLIVMQRHHAVSIVLDPSGAGAGRPYIVAFLAASLIGIFQFIGFEACGNVAEEVARPGTQIPKAMRYTIYVGGAAATFACLALILAVPDISAVVTGQNTDPVGSIFATAFGPIMAGVVYLVVLISFISCCTSLHAAASRLIFSYARDNMLIGSSFLARFSQKRHVPPYALLVSALIPAAIVSGSLFSTNALTKIISFAGVGIYIAFQMVVLAALRARFHGWIPTGPFSMGRWGTAVNVLALLYGIAAIINMSWPVSTSAAWHEKYLVPLSEISVIGAGLIYMAVTRRYDCGSAPAGDALVNTSQEQRVASNSCFL
jgi:amino acid transporter